MRCHGQNPLPQQTTSKIAGTGKLALYCFKSDSFPSSPYVFLQAILKAAVRHSITNIAKSSRSNINLEKQPSMS